MRKAAISFGLVYIPVKYENATQEQSISFNQLHKDTKERIRYKKSTATFDEVPASDIVKGYEYEKDKYVIMEEEDFDKIKTEKDRNIHIVSFTDLSDIDPIFYEKSYYLVPDGSDKAFALLSDAILAENKVAIAKTVLGTKETLVAIRPYQSSLLMETMFYLNEIKQKPQTVINIQTNEQEMNMAQALIQSMSKPFAPEDFKDEYQDRLRHAIAEKINGQEITEAPPENHDNVVSLMDALQASMEALNGVNYADIAPKSKRKTKV